MTQRDDFVAAQVAKVGSAYSTGPSRCTGANGYFDCSGLQVYAGNRVGLNYPCTSSFGFAIQCHQAPRPAWMVNLFGPGNGLSLTATQARATAGAWGFHGRNEARGPSQVPNGADGHIKCSLGDGRSVEAFDHAEGVIIGTFLDLECTYFALPPGLTGFNTSHSGTSGGSQVGMTAAIIVPGSKQQSGGRYPFIGMILQPDGTTDMVGFNGAHLNLNGEITAFGVRLVHMGRLNAPAVAAAADATGGVVFLAGDGGTFDCPHPTVQVG